jgi:hypothetical protein
LEVEHVNMTLLITGSPSRAREKWLRLWLGAQQAGCRAFEHRRVPVASEAWHQVPPSCSLKAALQSKLGCAAELKHLAPKVAHVLSLT